MQHKHGEPGAPEKQGEPGEAAEMLQEMRLLRKNVEHLNARLSKWEGAMETINRKEQNSLRRQQYQDAKKRRETGLLSLPEQNILKFRDRRLRKKFCQWATVGMRFAAADQPLQFITWLVHQWNNCTYLKKPITFSSSSFRIWNGHTRFAYGPRDLLHYTERKSSVLLRGPEEHDDFTKRPFWDWAYAVLVPVHQEMVEQGFEQSPERFKRHVQLLLGGFGLLEVYTDLYWDFCETRQTINRCLNRVGKDFQLILRAVHTGLRIKGTESPIPIPERRAFGLLNPK